MKSELFRMWCYSLILVLILVPFSYQSINNYRLPNDSLPYRYQIQLMPHMTTEDLSFDGESKIFLEVFKPTINITLNSLKLQYYEESTKLIGDEVFKPSRHILDDESEFLILNFHEHIEPGLYFLYLKYEGELNSKPMGFFRDYYVDDNNKQILLAATQFETTFARLAFPCWDEPAIKATFDISIKHLANYTALSNMPIKEIVKDTDIDGMVWSTFERTPQISSYLVSFTISNFENVSNSYGNFSLWSHKETLQYLSHSYEIGMKTFPILEEYTGIGYNMPKMDVIGVPGLSFGAMENWGLIIVMEYHLLTYNHSTDMDKFTTSTIIVHEIAHQWFGNIVSPAWWEDVWITEGLATYMHYFILSKVMNYPRIMDFFVVTNNFRVYSFETYYGKKAIYRNITSPKESIAHLSTVHDKAATVMHMISGLLSKEVFHAGIKKMLQTYKYGIISTDNFWNSMQEAMEESKLPYNNFNIKSRLDCYISQVGYPIINVERNYESGAIKLIQTSIEKDCDYFDCKQIESQRWWVPINLATMSLQNFSSSAATYWMGPEEKELIIDGVDSLDWYIINKKSVGFYRVNYDTENWKRIIDYMNTPNFKNIHVLNRAKLLDDAYYFAKNEKLDKNLLFNLTSYLVREDDLIPWKKAEIIFFFIFRFQGRTPENKKFILRLIEPLLEQTGLKVRPGDDFFTRLKRNIALTWICRISRKHCYINM
ncbi:aminopeptidase N-like [Leptopilina heterotoma]|uniref:aminopeptidase N-like n=1 Tax=Leptopilina heterotoma TaxID=63436 RepID=UPI001CA8D858|nr:aminopeptidase N-like [Leptopilina heterotoma]